MVEKNSKTTRLSLQGCFVVAHSSGDLMIFFLYHIPRSLTCIEHCFTDINLILYIYIYTHIYKFTYY